MHIFNIYDQTIGKNQEIKDGDLATFLHEHLEEYGDEKSAIQKAIDFVFQSGGRVVIAKDDDQIMGAVVINATGMSDYIPENILVYIAIHRDYRGKGIGKSLMKQALDGLVGDVALHVEANNPAVHLYKSLGFTNPYLEMRLKRS
jgi:ribosomal-protein-alanine N-acetyltransferase